MRLSTLFLAALVGLLPGCDDSGKETGDTQDTDPGVNLDDVDGDGLGADEDCDDTDASVGGPTTAWLDADADGYGDADRSVETCTPGSGNVANREDCDDADAEINPGATEICSNGVDDNCDGAIDDGASSGSTWYTDADADGFGDPATAVVACDAPAGAVAVGDDCDDTAANVYPGATEVCDAFDVDEDCDGAADDADDSTTGRTSWFLDADGDGYGDDAVAVDACDLPDGYAATPGDCDDADVAYNPGAVESDCADPADYNCDGSTGYADADGDGYVACEECDDASATVNPGAAEVCNGIDDDCDADIDSTATDAGTWYADADGDTYGDPAVATVTCDAPAGTVADATDCDDAAAAVNPGAAEVCDGAIDEDCDGLVDDADDSTTGSATWYTDVDGDGYGDPTTAVDTCTAPALGVADGTDCDDTHASVNPGAVEVCDSLDLDEDCDGAADDADPSLSDAPTWYADADGDTYGVEGSSLAACDQPAGYAVLVGDCNDADTAFHPDADESDCSDLNDYNCDGSVGYADADADGWAACEECDDAEATTFPGADEYCDGADNDCDGSYDESDALDAGTWYADADEDGYGDAATGLAACEEPAGYGTDATDCDDAAPRVHPGATEVCDDADVDEDCDALADDADASVTGQLTAYVDADADGFGDDATAGLATCDLPAGSVTVAGDCDDANLAVNPDATEVCDAADVDEDCDGLSDDADADVDGGATWYVDLDGDGYGDAADAGIAACDLPAGYVANNTDCDDGDLSVNPGAVELCDAADVDEDCDGAADDADASVSGTSTYYLDLDGDGYGSAVGVEACEAPAGAVADASDCDDAAYGVNPGAVEICDAANTDEDCDGSADDADASATGQDTWYTDADGDGHGGSATVLLCDATADVLATSDDCDDTAGSVYPGATETCNGGDDDCDGTVDEADAADATTWYADADLDGYGAAGTALSACTQPAGYVASATDCDDAAGAINPGATEVCDAADTDEDCDGAADEADTSASGKGTYYADADADGFGDDGDAGTLSCDPGAGLVTDHTDCDDGRLAVNPSATEVCNGLDDNCDGSTDGEDATGVATWYADADGDGYGDAGSTDASCTQPAGYVADATDCDDARGAVHPGATEVCDGADTDEDCDGSADDLDTAASGKARYYTDADHDGYGDDGDAGALYCDPAATLVTDHTDCDDTRAPVSPAGTEVCDGFDNNCDGTTDGDDAADVATWYADADGDTYGDPAATDLACVQPSGFVADDTDCDDTAASVSPAGTETCNDEDDDCDGSVDESATDFVTWYADADGDTYGDASVTTLECSAPAGYVADATDCDDTAAGVHPGATERCDSADTDEDCDGAADDLDTAATGKTRYYGDADRDGYGDDTDAGALYCDPAATLVTSHTDCDDARAAVSPAGTEVCNGLDDNCDGTTDGDDAADVATWYADADGDTYGNPAETDLACDQPAGFVADDTDCDDTAATVSPAGTESCNDEDDDCDGTVDEDATDFVTWYADADGDTYGDAAVSELTCSAPDGYVADDTDCDDEASGVHPGATERCDAADADEDCDGAADDLDTVASGKSRYYTDADGDTYGDEGDAGALYCDPAADLVTTHTDCDDTRSAVSPAGNESCNGLDDNCDGLTDGPDAYDVSSWYADADGDTYGDPAATDDACTQPAGFVADATDCDDTAASVNPAGTETCNGEDDDCDGGIDDGATDFVTWYSDFDGDSYGDSGTSELACQAPTDYVALDGDCDDANAAANPGEAEVCDTADVDEDCDGLSDDADPSASGSSTWYYDGDSDGYGVADPVTTSCDQPSGYTADAGDCDDGESTTNPGAAEVCNDGVDNDCVEATTCRDWADTEALTDASGSYTGVSFGASGTSTTGSLGGGVAGGKDVNGDGYADVLLADRLYDSASGSANQNVGRTYLLTGSSSGLPTSLTSAAATFMVSYSTTGGDRSGQGVALLDDIDADGDDEVLVAAYASNLNGTDSGEVRLFRGSSTISGNLTTSSAYVTLAGPAANAFGGWQVEQVGDVNDDGVADWAASAAASSTFSGTVVSGTTATGTYTAGSSSALLANLTSSGAQAGFADDIDLDGDGVSDLVAMGPTTTGVTVFNGYSGFGGSLAAASADASITGMTLAAISTGTTYYGHSLANAGDNNGDGYEDLLVGGDGYDTTLTDVGRAYLFLGPISSSTTVASAVATVSGAGASDQVGRSLGGNGDVDGDGFDDFVVGAPGHDNGGATTVNNGAAALLYGPTVGDLLLTTTTDAHWIGGSGVALGSAARIVGDVDADGYDDFMLGAPVTLNGSSAQVGAAYLFFGSGE